MRHRTCTIFAHNGDRDHDLDTDAQTSGTRQGARRRSCGRRTWRHTAASCGMTCAWTRCDAAALELARSAAQGQPQQCCCSTLGDGQHMANCAAANPQHFVSNMLATGC